MNRSRGVLYATGVFLFVGPPLLWVFSSVPAQAVARPVEPEPQGPRDTQLAAAVTPVPLPALAELIDLAQRDPIALVRRGEERCLRDVPEYRCTLVKQELLGNELSPVQEVELRYRYAPRAVYMLWRTNAESARRALYMEGGDYVGKKGEKLARVEPAGKVARLFVKDTFVPVDGPQARKASRRRIDEAGFHATFQLWREYNAVAEKRGVLNLRYGGTGNIDGRPTLIILRDLPYEGAGGPYPDARLVMHLDQEWLLPVAVYSYADQEQKQLLGSYVFVNVDLKPHFRDDDFQF